MTKKITFLILLIKNTKINFINYKLYQTGGRIQRFNFTIRR